jgi:hypothetical protein
MLDRLRDLRLAGLLRRLIKIRKPALILDGIGDPGFVRIPDDVAFGPLIL